MTAGGSSIPEVQRLLSVLAAGRRCAELGTAFGEGAAAMAQTARSVVTVERDPERAERARRRLEPFRNVELRVGDWRDVLPARAPFELVFLDEGAAKYDEETLELAAPGGLFLLDDLTPGRPGVDPLRELWLERLPVVAVEILTTPASAAILAVRR